MPSDAEWNYASSGGSEERPYAWGATDPGANVSLAIWGCYYNGSGACTDVTNIGFVGLVSAGNGRYGQSDLAGNILEWNLDMNASYTGPCFDCANATAGTGRVVRGGVYNSNSATYLRNGLRSQTSPVGRYPLLGGRCARTP